MLHPLGTVVKASPGWLTCTMCGMVQATDESWRPELLRRQTVLHVGDVPDEGVRAGVYEKDQHTDNTSRPTLSGTRRYDRYDGRAGPVISKDADELD